MNHFPDPKFYFSLHTHLKTPPPPLLSLYLFLSCHHFCFLSLRLGSSKPVCYLSFSFCIASGVNSNLLHHTLQNICELAEKKQVDKLLCPQSRNGEKRIKAEKMKRKEKPEEMREFILQLTLDILARGKHV